MTEHIDTQQNSSPNAGPSLFHTLQAADATSLIEFLTETFGFVLTARYEDGGRVAHAELRWPEGAGGVMLGTYDESRDWAQKPGTAGAYIVTAHVDALHQRAVEHDAEVVMPLTDMDYDSREFAVRDPEGNLWSFGTYAGEPLPGS